MGDVLSRSECVKNSKRLSFCHSDDHREEDELLRTCPKNLDDIKDETEILRFALDDKKIGSFYFETASLLRSG